MLLLYLFGSFALLISLGMPIAFVIGISSMIAFLGSGYVINVSLSATTMFGQMQSFPLLAIPFFILAGEVMTESGITSKIIKLSNSLIGHIRGGLAHVNILASMFFAGVSGSPSADSAAIGAILIPAMVEEGYDPDFAIAVTASSSCIGPIIPPSTVMILYSAMTGVSVGAMFMGGIIPGVMVGLSLMVISYIICIKRGYDFHSKRSSFGEIWSTFLQSSPALIMPIIVIGGILFGFYTATEAGVIACLYGFAYGFLARKLNIRSLQKILTNAGVTTCVVWWLIACSATFSNILIREQFQNTIMKLITSFSSQPAVIMLLIILILLVLGCFIDVSALIIIFGAVFHKLGQDMGFDPVHFGVVVVITLLVGCITPPVGSLLFIDCGIAKVPLSTIFKIIPYYVLAMVVVILLCAYIPGIVTFIPDIIFK